MTRTCPSCKAQTSRPPNDAGDMKCFNCGGHWIVEAPPPGPADAPTISDPRALSAGPLAATRALDARLEFVASCKGALVRICANGITVELEIGPDPTIELDQIVAAALIKLGACLAATGATP